MLPEQLLCVRENAGAWDYSSENGEDAGPQGAHIMYIKCMVSQLVKSAMEEKHMMEVPGGVEAPMSPGKMRLKGPDTGKEQVKQTAEERVFPVEETANAKWDSVCKYFINSKGLSPHVLL